MTKKVKNLTAVLLTGIVTVAAVFLMWTATALTADEGAAYAADTKSAVNIGRSVLETGANTSGAQTLWFGQDTADDPIPWYITGVNGTGMSAEGTYGLLAAENIDTDNWNFRNALEYDYSELYWYMEDYEDKLTVPESGAIQMRYFEVKDDWGGLDTDWFKCQRGVIGMEKRIWPLTIKDAARRVDQSLLALDPDDPDNYENCWWLGSRGYSGNTAAYVKGNGVVETEGEYIFIDPSGDTAPKLGIRPACFLGYSDIILTSDAENGKDSGEPGSDALREVSQSGASSGWKITLKADHSSFKLDTCCIAYNKDTKVLTVPYQKAKTGDNEYISMIIKDADDTVRYYGRVSKPSSENGSFDVDLNGKFTAGDKIYVFNEQYNGKKRTDYSSELIELPVTYNENKTAGHDLMHNEKRWPKVGETGHDEFWTCRDCGWYFSDAEAQHQIYSIQPVYMVTVSPETVDFGTSNDGYAQPEPETVSITNNGNYTITLDQPDLGSDSSWNCSELSKTSLGAGETATFTVSPKSGLTPQDTFTSKSYNITADITYRDDNESAQAQAKLQFSVRADVETISGFAFIDGTRGNSDQGPEKLVDGTTDTKWCNNTSSWENGKCFVEFETDKPLTPKGYFLYTGGDTKSYPGRNPTDWVLLGRNDPKGEWCLIDEKTGYDDMPAANNQRCQFMVENGADDSYRYFRFEVSGIKSGDVFQLSEFELIVKALDVTYLKVSPCKIDFGAESQGYEQPETKTVSITNMEASDITITQPESEYYDISELSKTTIAQGETADFTVVPKAGLISGGNGGKGIYDEVLLIDYKDQRGHTASRQVRLAFYVKDDAETLTRFRLLDGTRGEDESPLKNLIDGDRETTYLTHNSTWASKSGFVDFETDDPVVPEKFVLVTAKEDTGGRSRHPWHFRLYGKNSLEGEWTQLYQIEWAQIEQKPLVPYEYTVNNDSGAAYRYFRWECYRTTNDIGFMLGEIELIATPRKQGTLTLPSRKLDFGTWSEDYDKPDSKKVEITNNEVVPVTLEQPSLDGYTIGKLSKKTLQPGEKATFTIAPEAGLAPGDHSDFLKLHYNDGEETYKLLQVDFKVAQELFGGFSVTDSSPGGKTTSADKLVDGDINTKWMSNKLVQWDDGKCFVEFRTGIPLMTYGYVLTTCKDTENKPQANPKDWKLFGKNSKTGKWVLLSSVVNDNVLEAVNSKDYLFPVSNSAKNFYQEYRFEVSDVQSGTNFQLAELRLLTNSEQEGYINTYPTDVRFETKAEGYEDPETKTVTITNYRLPAVTLKKPTAVNYDIIRFQKTTLKKGETLSFIVKPKAGLLFGNYNEDLKISYTDSKGAAHTLTVPLHFIVEAQGSWAKGPDDLEFIYGTPGIVDEAAGSNQGPEMLLDGNVETKWCNHIDEHWSQTDGKCYIDFKTADQMIPTRYSYTTGGDSYSYQGRIPREWKLFGRNSEDEPWTVIDSVNKDQGNGNYERFEYSIPNDTLAAYQYYRFEVVLLKAGTTFQLSEFELFLIPPKTVTFDANGGTVDPAVLKTGSGRKIAKLPVPENGEEKFAGWFTEPEGGKRVTEDTVFNEDMTVYAHWGEEPEPEPEPEPDPATKKKANPAVFRGKTVKASAKKLKKKAVIIKRKAAIYIAKKKGTVTFTKVSVNKKKYAKKFLINKKTGKITLKKGIKKGLYKFRIRVRDTGNKFFRAKSKVITVTIKVR